MKRFLAAAVAATGLAGCVTDISSPMGWRNATEAERLDYAASRCAAYGFTPETPEMAQCVANEYRALDADTQAAFNRLNSSVMSIRPPTVVYR